jgi:lipoate-protein ligase B
MLCTVYQLGLIAYSEAYHLQRQLLCQRVNNEITDTLLLLEHPPTITIGKSGKLENVLASQAQLAEAGVSLFFVDRGGDVTYHGPGQLVAYPIIDLRQRGKDAHQYVRDLEEVIIRTLNGFSINACRDRSHAGVWVRGKEIAALGLRISKWVSMHGFALNVNPNLKQFSLINPCGFSDRKATSISNLLSQDVSMDAVNENLLAHFSEVFDSQMEQGSDILARGAYEGKAALLV